MGWGGSMGCEGRRGFELFGLLFGLVNLEMAQGVDKVLNAGKLTINGGKPNIGNFVFVAEGTENKFTNFSAGGFAATALLELAFKIIDDRS